MKPPYKNVGVPTPLPTKGQTPKATLPVIPGKRDPQVNEQRVDSVPEKSPPLPWPASKPLEGGKPMKLSK